MASPVHLPVAGKFDLVSACNLRDRIAGLPPGSIAQVDFSHASQIHDFALAALVGFLSELHCRMTTRGLSQHHLSILRHLGASKLVEAEPL